MFVVRDSCCGHTVPDMVLDDTDSPALCKLSFNLTLQGQCRHHPHSQMEHGGSKGLSSLSKLAQPMRTAEILTLGVSQLVKTELILEKISTSSR